MRGRASMWLTLCDLALPGLPTSSASLSLTPCMPFTMAMMHFKLLSHLSHLTMRPQPENRPFC